MEKELIDIVKDNNDKLNLIIATLSAHPDYEESMKKGLMGIDIENCKGRVEIENDEVMTEKIKLLAEILDKENIHQNRLYRDPFTQDVLEFKQFLSSTEGLNREVVIRFLMGMIDKMNNDNKYAPHIKIIIEDKTRELLNIEEEIQKIKDNYESN